MIQILPSISATRENVSKGIHPQGLKLVTCDCRILLPELHNVHVSFVKRSANLVVHFVAKGAQAYADQFVRVLLPHLSKLLIWKLIRLIND